MAVRNNEYWDKSNDFVDLYKVLLRSFDRLLGTWPS